eukprot:gene48801-27925_t
MGGALVTLCGGAPIASRGWRPRHALWGRHALRGRSHRDPWRVPPDLACCTVCNDCRKALQSAATLPPYQPNDNLCGPVPPELRDLTLGERLYINRARTYAMCITLKDRVWESDDGKQRAMRGNTISFPLHSDKSLPDTADRRRVVERAPSLPQRTHELVDWLTIFLTGPDKDEAHNADYADVTVDESALAELPADAVPDGLTACVQLRADDAELKEQGPASAVAGGVGTLFRSTEYTPSNSPLLAGHHPAEADVPINLSVPDEADDAAACREFLSAEESASKADAAFRRGDNDMGVQHRDDVTVHVASAAKHVGRFVDPAVQAALNAESVDEWQDRGGGPAARGKAVDHLRF